MSVCSLRESQPPLGIHDIYSVSAEPPAKPIMLQSVSDRIGTPSVKIDPSKVLHVCGVSVSHVFDSGSGAG